MIEEILDDTLGEEPPIDASAFAQTQEEVDSTTASAENTTGKQETTSEQGTTCKEEAKIPSQNGQIRFVFQIPSVAPSVFNLPSSGITIVEMDDGKDRKEPGGASISQKTPVGALTKSKTQRTDVHVLIDAASQTLQDSFIDKLADLSSFSSRVEFYTRWERLSYSPHTVRYLPLATLSELILTVGSNALNMEAFTMILQINLKDDNHSKMLERLKTILQDLDTKKDRKKFECIGDLQMETIKLTASAAHVYQLLTDLDWDAKHDFISTKIVNNNNKDKDKDKEKPECFGIHVHNQQFGLHHSDFYKRWLSMREQLEAKNRGAFLFWMHRLFGCGIPFV
jgi:hypothetical protein